MQRKRIDGLRESALGITIVKINILAIYNRKSDKIKSICKKMHFLDNYLRIWHPLPLLHEWRITINIV